MRQLHEAPGGRNRSHAHEQRSGFDALAAALVQFAGNLIPECQTAGDS